MRPESTNKQSKRLRTEQLTSFYCVFKHSSWALGKYELENLVTFFFGMSFGSFPPALLSCFALCWSMHCRCAWFLLNWSSFHRPSAGIFVAEMVIQPAAHKTKIWKEKYGFLKAPSAKFGLILLRCLSEIASNLSLFYSQNVWECPKNSIRVH